MGTAKFAHFINVEYMDDLIKTLNEIVEAPDCGALECLLCIRTVFTILSGQGSALNIDPLRFYEHLFRIITSMDGTENRTVVVEVLECVHRGFVERKKLVSLERAGKCAKCVVNLTIRTPVKETIALLLILKSILLAHPRLDNLLDSEYVCNSGMPSLNDDGTCPGSLWELHLLRKHHNSAVRSLVEKILGTVKNFSNSITALSKYNCIEFLKTGHSPDYFDVEKIAK